MGTPRWLAAAVAAAALGAALSPLARGLHHDSFPLSNYPMFTAEQPATASFVRALGVDTAGAQRVLGPELAGGTVEVIHANRTLRRALREGRADEMCGEIAARVAAEPPEPEIVTVLIVVERYDVVAALRAGDPRPIRRDERARCAVEPP